MDLVTLVADIREETNKDVNALTDAKIRSSIRDALTHIETEEDWVYMDTKTAFTIDPADPNPERIAMPSRIKKIEYVFTQETTGDSTVRHWIDEVKPEDINSIREGRPERYWKDSMNYLYWDRTPTDEIYTGELSAYTFTTWSDADVFEPWIFESAHTYVKLQAIVFLAPFLREPEMLQTYGELFRMSREAALVMNTELELGNQKPRMKFS